PAGQDVDFEGNGEVLRIIDTPHSGMREITLDEDSGLIDGESIDPIPLPYQLARYGASSKMIALSFDDGPDPKVTPQILDILKSGNVQATFFSIGLQAEKHPELIQRLYREGHEVGNHTWTHPNISIIGRQYLEGELNLTEQFFESVLGVKPLFFRPPY